MQYELVTLVAEGLRRGHDKKTILETLVREGWDEMLVESTLASFDRSDERVLPEAFAFVLQHPLVVATGFFVAFFVFFGQSYLNSNARLASAEVTKATQVASVAASGEAQLQLNNFSIAEVATATESGTVLPGSRVQGVSAPRYLVADLDGETVYVHKGESDSAPIASLTKLMTALVAAEYIPLTDDLIVPKEALVGTTIRRLKAGQSINAYQLLFPLLMESSNEAAETFAARLGRTWFIDRMNTKAAELGLEDTQFTDPAGLDAGNVSSVTDLLSLARYISEHKSFILKITAGDLGETEYGVPKIKDLRNFNDFQGKDGFVGGKIGNTDEAKETGLFVFDLTKGTDTHRVVIILLGSENQKQDAQVLLQYVKRKYF
jgi:D-alanyl-D-alanine carboxypeptidase